MTPRLVESRATRWTVLSSVILAMGACSASDPPSQASTSAAKGSAGAVCATNANCISDLCSSGHCVGNSVGKGSSESCTAPAQCASGVCTNGICAVGQNLAPGSGCSLDSECQSGTCQNHACVSYATPGTGQGGASSSDGSLVHSPFQGMGVAWRPLTTGCGPQTAQQCGGVCEQQNDASAKVIRAPATFCFGADSTKGIADPSPDDPAAMIEQVIETQNGVSYVHIRVTFDPSFVDNTYGTNASSGWFASANGKAGKGHTFNGDLTGSDHLELLLTDASGATVMSFGEDYISSLAGNGAAKPPGKPGPVGTGGAAATGTGGSAGLTSACGHANLGVLGGDGKMMTGNASDVLATSTSLDRNLNGCGYCQSAACAAAAGASSTSSAGDCTVDSPLTDEKYTPNTATPHWNYAVVYEVWLKLSAFASGGGFGQAYITFVHASPSKIPGNNTLYVVPTPCPPNWSSCPPGQSCPPNGSGGATGVAGAGNVPGCPPNYEVSITLEDVRSCSPIPFAGWPNMSACPAGYALKQDVTDESQHCVPAQ